AARPSAFELQRLVVAALRQLELPERDDPGDTFVAVCFDREASAGITIVPVCPDILLLRDVRDQVHSLRLLVIRPLCDDHPSLVAVIEPPVARRRVGNPAAAG